MQGFEAILPASTARAINERSDRRALRDLFTKKEGFYQDEYMGQVRRSYLAIKGDGFPHVRGSSFELPAILISKRPEMLPSYW